MTCYGTWNQGHINVKHLSNVYLYFCHWALLLPFSLDDHCQNRRNQLCDPLQLVFDQLLLLSSLVHPNHHLHRFHHPHRSQSR